jgi:hypothetical protein
MWETTALHVPLSKVGKKLRFVVSHISRKTSEIWGTPRFLEGEREERSTVPTIPGKGKRAPEGLTRAASAW